MSYNSIVVENLNKYFEVYKNPQDRLKDILFPVFQKMICKPVQEYHQKFWALKNVSFEIKKGETVGILGQNGSGKSTLLQIIMGTMRPSSGKVSVIGKVSGLLELGSGFNPDFTGRENVYLNGSLLGLSKDEINNKFDDIVSFADIGEHLDMTVKTYSSGMMLRLAFAVHCFVESDILIIDEALAVGDARFQLKCFRKLQEIKDRGTTILFVSHAIDMVKSFCNKGIVLDYGCMKYIGEATTAATLYHNILFPDIKAENTDILNENKIDSMQKKNDLESVEDKKIILTNLKKSWGIGGFFIDKIEMNGIKNKCFMGRDSTINIVIYYNLDVKYISNHFSVDEKKIYIGIRLDNQSGITIFDAFHDDILNKKNTGEQVLKCNIVIPKLRGGNYFFSFGAAVGRIGQVTPLCSYDDAAMLSIEEDVTILGLMQPTFNFMD